MKNTKDQQKYFQKLPIPPPYFPITFEKDSIGEGYPCDYCTLLFVSKRDLILHMKSYPNSLTDFQLNAPKPLHISVNQSSNIYRFK